MLPDFPILKAKLLKFWNFYGDERRKMHLEVVRDVPSFRHYEGNRWKIVRNDGTETESEYKEIHSEFVVHDDEVPDLTPNILAERIDKVAKEMADQLERGFFQTLVSETEASGRGKDNQGRPFDKDLFLDALNSITISFDKRGNPNLPTLYVSPALGDSVRKMLPVWNQDQELKKQVDAIIERKREEWRVRESYRKLVK